MRQHQRASRLGRLLTAVLFTLASAVGVAGFSVVAATPAQAAVLGDDYPAYLKNAAQDALVDPWLFYNRECTSFVAWRLNNANGVGFTNSYMGQHWGNADHWGTAARSAGISVDMTPTVGAVAWWSSGHVAWVAEVNGGSVTIEEYNYNWTGTYNSRSISASGVSGYIHVRDVAGGVGEGSFVSHNGYVYRIAGGAPLYVSTWNVYGGGQPTTELSDAQFSKLRAYPADGTFVNGLPSGRVFRFAGGAPEYVSTWSSYGGGQPTIAVDDFALDHPDGAVPLDHIRTYPVDGTFVSNTADGRVYRIAGGAPLYVSSWDNIGGAQATTSLDPWEFSNYQHLRPVPADMFIRGLPSGRVFRVVAAGRPYYVESWDPYGGAQPFLDVDDWAIDNCDHLDCSPFGSFDTATSGAGQITVKGWAIDPNARTSPTTVHVYVGGPAGDSAAQGFNIGAASSSRPDVAKAYPGTGSTHGFGTTITTSKRGSQKVYVYALNVDGTIGNNTLLGSKTISISAPAVLTQTPVPSVSGTVRVGQTLTAIPGTWLPAPVALAYQWLRNGVVVSGATKASYVLTSADLGAVMSVRVTGSKAGYTAVSKTSAGTAKVLAAVAVSGPAPTISGTVRVGKVLTAKSGGWQPAPVMLGYQWSRNGSVVAGATKSTYALSAADLGAVVSVRVTGSKSGYASVVRVSKVTKRVVAGVLSGVKPKVSGKAKVGRTLSVKPGVWKPAGVVLAYQWLRNGKKIAGATGAGYLVVKADKGKKLTVKVTGTLAGYTTLAKTSKKTAKIK